VKLAYDHQIFTEQEFGGISRYVADLAVRMAVRPDYRVAIIAPFHCNAYLEDAGVAPLVRGHRIHSRRLRKMWRTLALVNRIASATSDRAVHDVVHETHYSQHAFLRARARVVTVHDMIHELFPQWVRRAAAVSAAKRAAVARADHVLCNSATTRADLLRLFDVEPAKTSVVYHGHSLVATNDAGMPAAAAGGRPEILYVGLRKSYKNFDQLVRAFAASQRLRAGFGILAFGGGAFSQSELALFASLGVTASLRHEAGDDNRLAGCYRRACMFVYPSGYEGFGLPPLEAMHYGCPVVCTRLGAVPEVVAEAGRHFDPGNLEEFRDALESVAFNDNLRAAMIARGRVRARLFTMDKCAAGTAALYERLAGRAGVG
jgi:glycosyltransferase involved in cell wall biosynthesis